MAEEIVVAEAEIQPECHVVNARISTAMYRYFRPVLLHVESAGRDGATPESLSEDLFFGMESVSRRLLEICADEKMVTRVGGGERYTLSERGREAIKDGKILARATSRMWKIHHTECELVPAANRVLMLDEGSREADHRGHEDSGPTYLSNVMSELEGKVLMPVLGKNTDPVRIEEFNSEHEKEVKTNVRLRLRVRLAEDEVRLDLDAYDGEKKIGAASVKSEKTLGDVVEELLDGGGEYRNDGIWDREKHKMLVRFGDTSSDERASMKRTLMFEQPEAYGCQFSGKVRIRVGIHPEDDYEAKKWAKWLVGRRVGELVGSNEYKKIKDKMVRLFPKFDLGLKETIAEYFEEDDDDYY